MGATGVGGRGSGNGDGNGSLDDGRQNAAASALRRDAASGHAAFWDRQARNLHWFEPWTDTLEWRPPYARWFVGGTINASYNALDVHQYTIPDKPAIIWEAEDGKTRVLTYGQMLRQVSKFANVLKSLGVRRGDRVTLYLPMIPELPIAMLACARIGATHSVIFSGFSAAAVRDRITHSESSVVVTADGGFRRGRIVRLKEIVDQALDGIDSVRSVVVVRRAQNEISMEAGRDRLWDEMMAGASDVCEPERLPSTHPLYILYTSGTTGRPKGVLHGTGGYLTHLHATFGWCFGLKQGGGDGQGGGVTYGGTDDDVFFCTADIGWVTGHSYVVYAPLLHGMTQVMYEGAPDYPDPSRMWEMIQRHRVTIFYTTPTALRMFMKFGDGIPGSFELGALRLLGTVGEPINPRVWEWYHKTIGGGRCPIVDTWWQTETGGMLISPLPGLETIPLKPGSGTLPIPGVIMDIVDEGGRSVGPDTKGHLIIRNQWPGMLLTLWGDDKKYEETYWSRYPGAYHTGDYARRDADGYIWLLGRADDVLKVAGHRIGTAELEGCIVSHGDIAEAAVCGVPDEIKGEAIIAFAVPSQAAAGTRDGNKMREEITSKIRSEVGAIATPRQIYLVSKLPKTRSGKIMRRLLRSVASGQQTGDISTIEDGTAVDEVRAALEQLRGELGGSG